MSKITEDTLYCLMQRNEELETEVEILRDRINRAINYMETNNFYIGAFNSYTQPIVDILKGNDKEKRR
jgi:hypothetical protein